MRELEFLRMVSSAMLGTQLAYSVVINLVDEPHVGEVRGRSIKISHPKYGLLESLHILNHELAHLLLEHIPRAQKAIPPYRVHVHRLVWNIAADDAVRRFLTEVYSSIDLPYLKEKQETLLSYARREVDLSKIPEYPKDAPTEVVYRWLLERMWSYRVWGERGFVGVSYFSQKGGRGKRKIETQEFSAYLDLPENFRRVKLPSYYAERKKVFEKMRGLIPGSLRREWQWAEARGINFRKAIVQYLDTFASGRGEQITFLRPNKKVMALNYPIMIPVSSRRVLSCLVAVDTSSSLGDRELDVFLSVLHRHSHLLDMDLLLCDAKVHETIRLKGASPGEISARLRGLSIVGRGGTDYGPVFDHYFANRRRYSLLIYFTDLFCSFPSRHPERILWVVHLNDQTMDKKPPYGRVIWI